MNRDVIEGNWKQLKGKVKQRWDKLTDDQLDLINGKRDQLGGRLQELYGESTDGIEKQIREFEKLIKADYRRRKAAADH